MTDDRWTEGDAYDLYMGRWSRALADEFLSWVGTEGGLSWLDVGCGTGALAEVICACASPTSVVGCDPSAGFIETAKARVTGAEFVVGGVGSLPARDGGFDRVVSNLVLNFVPDPVAGVGEMASRATSGGLVAACVWDYAGEMKFLRIFWDEAVALDESANAMDEGVRFPDTNPDGLTAIFTKAGLRQIETGSIQIPTVFADFADYWKPFLGAAGPAPAFVASLDEENRESLRSNLEARLGGAGGPISLIARAWAVKGLV